MNRKIKSKMTLRTQATEEPNKNSISVFKRVSQPSVIFRPPDIMSQSANQGFIKQILDNKQQIQLIRARDADYMQETLYKKYGSSVNPNQNEFLQINANADQLIESTKLKIDKLTQNMQSFLVNHGHPNNENEKGVPDVQPVLLGSSPFSMFGLGSTFADKKESSTLQKGGEFKPMTSLD